MQDNEHYGSVASSMKSKCWPAIIHQWPPRCAHELTHPSDFYQWFKIRSSCEVSSHGWGWKKYSKPFSACPQKVNRQVLWKKQTKLCPFSASGIKTPLAEQRAEGFSATVPSPSGQTPNRLRHIHYRVDFCFRIYCCTVLLHQPIHTFSSEHRHEAKWMHNLTEVETLVFGKCSIQIPIQNTPDFFLAAFLKLSGQMSEYYIQFSHCRFLPYAVTGGFVKQPPATT